MPVSIHIFYNTYDTQVHILISERYGQCLHMHMIYSVGKRQM